MDVLPYICCQGQKGKFRHLVIVPLLHVLLAERLRGVVVDGECGVEGQQVDQLPEQLACGGAQQEIFALAQCFGRSCKDN